METALQLALGRSPLMTGVWLLPWTGAPMLIMPLAGRLAGRYGERAFMIAGLALQAIGLGWVLFRGAPAYFDGILVTPPARGAVPDDMGETPFFAAFFVVVNIHHYFMDYVIWRRENPLTRYLRPAPVRAASPAID